MSGSPYLPGAPNADRIEGTSAWKRHRAVIEAEEARREAEEEARRIEKQRKYDVMLLTSQVGGVGLGHGVNLQQCLVDPVAGEVRARQV